MKTITLTLCAVCFTCVLACTTCRLAGADEQTPEQLYAAVQRFQEQLQQADRELADLQQQADAQQRALANYQYLVATNAHVIARLQQGGHGGQPVEPH